MVICHCRVVSDSGIRSAVDGGALDVDSVVRYCGAGSVCGGCRPAIATLLADLTGVTAPCPLAPARPAA